MTDINTDDFALIFRMMRQNDVPIEHVIIQLKQHIEALEDLSEDAPRKYEAISACYTYLDELQTEMKTGIKSPEPDTLFTNVFRELERDGWPLENVKFHISKHIDALKNLSDGIPNKYEAISACETYLKEIEEKLANTEDNDIGMKP